MRDETRAVVGAWTTRLAIPLIVAPMNKVSSLELVVAACRNGAIGAFPTHNTDDLPAALRRLHSDLGGTDAPLATNLIVHRTNARRDADLEVLVADPVDLVIASVGNPEPVVAPLHAAGSLVFADVASVRHAHRALDAGVDGLVLLSAGAAGQTGWLNPLAFIRAVRAFFDGPLVLAGGVGDGASLAAAVMAGADLAYVGTRFVACTESAAADDYKDAVVRSGADDVVLTDRLTGLPANALKESVPDHGDAPAAFQQDNLALHRDTWSAGHSVSMASDRLPAAELIQRLAIEYHRCWEALPMVAALPQ